jgi:electron transfer flavoprotein alpha/beta subunit
MRTVALVRRASDVVAARLATRLGESVVLAAAPDGDELRALLSGSGAGRAVRLWDEALEGVDYLGVALALAGAVRTLGNIDVVVCADGGTGAVGPALAERLGWPHLGRVLDAWLEGDRLFARRRGPSGLTKLAAAPPAVLCVAEEPPAPLADGNSDLKIDQWSLSDASLTAAELTYRRSFRPRPVEGPEARPHKFADVAALVGRLRADGLVRG